MRKLLLLLPALLISCADKDSENIVPLEISEKNAQNIENIYDSYLETLESSDEGQVQSFHFDPLVRKKKKWELSGMKTILATGLSGDIGVLSWGGSKTVELIWKRLKKNTTANNVQSYSFEPELADERADVSLNSNSTYRDMQAQLEPLIQTMVKTGKVKNESYFRSNLYQVSEKFFNMSKAMDINKRTEWYPYKTRLDLVVSASGKVTGGGIIIKAGIDSRVRLEWVRLERKDRVQEQAVALKEDPVADKVQELLTQMAVDLSAAASSEKANIKNWSAKVFRVGIGITAKGDIGVISSSFGYTPYVYFKRIQPRQAFATQALDLETSFKDTNFEEGHWPVLVADELGSDIQPASFNLESNGKKAKVIKIKRKKLRKSINKAIKYGHKMGKKLKSKKYRKNKKWEVKTMKVGYKFSLNGDIGSVNVKTEPNLEIEYERIL